MEAKHEIHAQPIDKGMIVAGVFNSGLTRPQIASRVRHFTRAQKTAERRRRAALASAEAK